jgi:glutamyl/glutaminyl-tRNA synthetase
MSSDAMSVPAPGYRGRLAPSPTGLLHLGHARTFWTAYERAQSRRGVLVLRNEDLDRARCRAEYVAAFLEDLKWLGIQWDEGPDRGGPFGPYNQSERQPSHRAAFEKLRAAGFLYPCTCSRQDVLRALRAPHAGEEEPIYPGTCRDRRLGLEAAARLKAQINWRFRVPNGETIAFVDAQLGACEFVAGRDFGDFVVWRYDQTPSYQLAVVVDDAAMRITEVVRGADLLVSTARQLLLYRALEISAPAFCHCPLMTDPSGVRLAKRHDALSLRRLREQGSPPEEIRAEFSKNLLEKRPNPADNSNS